MRSMLVVWLKMRTPRPVGWAAFGVLLPIFFSGEPKLMHWCKLMGEETKISIAGEWPRDTFSLKERGRTQELAPRKWWTDNKGPARPKS